MWKVKRLAYQYGYQHFRDDTGKLTVGTKYVHPDFTIIFVINKSQKRATLDRIDLNRDINILEIPEKIQYKKDFYNTSCTNFESFNKNYKINKLILSSINLIKYGILKISANSNTVIINNFNSESIFSNIFYINNNIKKIYIKNKNLLISKKNNIWNVK